jgi:hypothetical protein
MCNHDNKAANPAAGFYSYVDYDDNLFMKYDTIIYFAAMSGSETMKVPSLLPSVWPSTHVTHDTHDTHDTRSPHAHVWRRNHWATASWRFSSRAEALSSASTRT